MTRDEELKQLKNEIKRLEYKIECIESNEARRLITVPELAKIFRIEEKTIYQNYIKNRLPYIKEGRRILFDYADVVQYLESRKKKPAHWGEIKWLDL